MGAMDHQLMVANESTYGTAVTVTRGFEYESESIVDDFRRTEGDPLRTGSGVIRSDRSTPYYGGAAGNVQMTVMTKGFGFWLRHMLGGSATTGPAETTVYTHTGTEGDLLGDSFTMQLNRPFHPAGTNQALTYEGGKITEWTIANSVDGNLLLDLGMDFEQVATGTALASASYPSAMVPLTWAGGVVTIGGNATAIDEISINWNNGLDVDRRQIRGNTDKKEPTASRREGSFTIRADFASMAERAFAAATTNAGTHAAIVATWTGPALLGSTIYPHFKVTIPAGRFDQWSATADGPDGLKEELSGAIRYDGTNSPVTIEIKNADATA